MSTSNGHNVGDSAFLKTTTWGALIALPLVAVAWGVSSFSPLAHDSADDDQVAFARPGCIVFHHVFYGRGLAPMIKRMTVVGQNSNDGPTRFSNSHPLF